MLAYSLAAATAAKTFVAIHLLHSNFPVSF